MRRVGEPQRCAHPTPAVGSLLFLFVPTAWALAFVAVGLVVCGVVTLAPLTRRKAVEAAVQTASHEAAEQVDAARFDPLDAAANAVPIESDSETADDVRQASAAALNALNTKETT